MGEGELHDIENERKEQLAPKMLRQLVWTDLFNVFIFL
jgi:hypothetical protein